MPERDGVLPRTRARRSAVRSVFPARTRALVRRDGEEGSTEQRFARLNMGRIPLTGAELCRALLISRAGREDGHPGADKPHASGLFAGRSQILLGSLWDDMERSLHEPSFRDFLGLDGDDSGAPRMGFLLDIVTGRPHGDPDDQFSFRRMSERLKQGERARSVWHDVVLSWQLLRFWHEDNDLYHWTGCLISKAVRHGSAVPCLQHLLALARENRKSIFRKKLLEEIRTVMFGGNALPDLHALRYDSDYDLIRRLLFLFNVELSREKGPPLPLRRASTAELESGTHSGAERREPDECTRSDQLGEGSPRRAASDVSRRADERRKAHERRRIPGEKKRACGILFGLSEKRRRKEKHGGLRCAVQRRYAVPAPRFGRQRRANAHAGESRPSGRRKQFPPEQRHFRRQKGQGCST